MIAYIRGILSYKSPTFIHLEAGQVAYHIHISLNTYSRLESLQEVKLWIHLHWKEDVQKLYGFYEEDEREVFVHLISVSGIGPNTAILILSAMTAIEVREAVAREAVHEFNKIKGIGPKTAKRLILDLKDKIGRLGSTFSESPDKDRKTPFNEARSALQSLGFRHSQINQVLSKLKDKNMEVEELVKEAIKHLSK